MARFVVYKNPRKETAREVPFLLDMQSDHLEGLESRGVVPHPPARYAVATGRAERDPVSDLRGALPPPRAFFIAALPQRRARASLDVPWPTT